MAEQATINQAELESGIIRLFAGIIGVRRSLGHVDELIFDDIRRAIRVELNRGGIERRQARRLLRLAIKRADSYRESADAL